MIRGVLAAAVLLAFARPALACGVGGAGGGDAAACSLDEHDEALRKKLHVGLAYTATWTALSFGDSAGVFDQQRQTALVTGDWRPTRTVSLQLAGGALTTGFLQQGTARYDLAPGAAVVVGASWRALEADGLRPFVVLTGQISAVFTSTRGGSAPDASYRAFDLRVGGVAGYPIEGIFTPYAVARLFGGPVFWTVNGADVVGSDRYHVQLGAGVAFRFWKRVDLFAEGVPLGERAVSGGLGLAF
jgi:hypothetical protein